MKITTDLITQKFHEFNTSYFNGELSLGFPIKLSKSTRMAGYVKASRVNNVVVGFYISTMFHENEKELDETILHEMIHVWQFQVDKISVNHDSRFIRKMEEINSSSGLNVSLKHSGSLVEKEKNSKRRECYFFQVKSPGKKESHVVLYSFFALNALDKMLERLKGIFTEEMIYGNSNSAPEFKIYKMSVLPEVTIRRSPSIFMSDKSSIEQRLEKLDAKILDEIIPFSAKKECKFININSEVRLAIVDNKSYLVRNTDDDQLILKNIIACMSELEESSKFNLNGFKKIVGEELVDEIFKDSRDYKRNIQKMIEAVEFRTDKLESGEFYLVYSYREAQTGERFIEHISLNLKNQELLAFLEDYFKPRVLAA